MGKIIPLITYLESASKVKPIITQEHTSNIENMINIYVLVEDWDTVIPRALPGVGLRRGENEVPEVSQEK